MHGMDSLSVGETGIIQLAGGIFGRYMRAATDHNVMLEICDETRGDLRYSHEPRLKLRLLASSLIILAL